VGVNDVGNGMVEAVRGHVWLWDALLACTAASDCQGYVGF